MIEGLYALFSFLLAIAILIAVHEYGHFIVARKLGIRVEKFSIGFGPSLLSWRSKDQEVEYVIAAIPLGGYVKMLGENENIDQQPLSESEKLRAYDIQPVWKRAAVAFAGPLFNFLFAILIYMVIGWLGQSVLPPVVGKIIPSSAAEQVGLTIEDRITHINQESIHSWRSLEEMLKQSVGQDITLQVNRSGSSMQFQLNLNTPEKDPLLINVARDILGISPGMEVYVHTIQEGSAAHQAGLKENDQILLVNGENIDDVRLFIQRIRVHASQAVTLSILRNDNMLNLSVTPTPDENGIGRIGISLQEQPIHAPVHYRMDLWDGFQYGFVRTWEMSDLTVQVLTKMLTSAISADNLGGPIAIAQLAGRAAEIGLVAFLSILALISINLGILNLLPVPILDGGHLVFLSLEAIRGKPLERKLMEFSQAIGIVLIMALMFFAFYNDLLRLFGA